MAVTTSPFSDLISGSALIVDLDMDNTAEVNVRAGTTTLFSFDVDNSANGAASYLKIWDSLSPTVGTTAPDYIFKIAASTREVIDFDLGEGSAFSSGLSFACVTAGGTGGTTSPTSNVIGRAVTS